MRRLLLLALLAACNSGSADPDDSMLPGGGALDTLLTVTPPARDRAALSHFEFRSDDATATFVCELDGIAQPCASPFEPALAEGEHTLSISAVTPAGDRDATPAAHTWVVDRTAPETEIAHAPQGLVADADADIGFRSADADVAGFEIRVDGGEWIAAVGPPHRLLGLAAGAHTVELRAHDAAGNVDESPAQASWTVDLVGPATALIGIAEDAYTRNVAQEFSFSAADASRFECLNGAGSFVTCTSPFTYTTTDGTRTFMVRAYDATGNQGPAATRTFHVDTVQPSLTIGGTPANNTHVRGKHVAFDFQTDEDNVRFSCAFLPADSLPSCPAHFEADVTDGYHELQVAVYDRAGNNVYKNVYFWVDSSIPTVAITATAGGLAVPENGATKEGLATFNMTTEQGANLTCRIVGQAFEPCAGSRQITFGSQGAFTFEAYAADAVDAGPVATFRINLDWTRPTVTWLSSFEPNACSPGTTKVVVAFLFDEPVQNVRVEWRGTLNAGGSYVTPIELADEAPDYYFVREDRPDGGLQARVLAADLVGNTRTSAWLSVPNCANAVGKL